MNWTLIIGPKKRIESREALNPWCLKSRVKFPPSVKALQRLQPYHQLVLVVVGGFIKSKINATNFRALQLSMCWQALWRCQFLFLVRLSTQCHSYYQMACCPCYYCSLTGQHTCLTWHGIYGLLSTGRWGTPGPKIHMSWGLLSKQPGLLSMGLITNDNTHSVDGKHSKQCNNPWWRSPDHMVREF